MERFRNGQRVKVTKPLNEEGEPDSARESLIGKIGTVVRLRMGDMRAFVSMDETPEHPLFPAGDERHNHVILYPEECERSVMEGENLGLEARFVNWRFANPTENPVAFARAVLLQVAELADAYGARAIANEIRKLAE